MFVSVVFCQKTTLTNVFTYVTYIQTSPEELWRALTKPEYTKRYWFGPYPISDWQPGSPWSLMMPDGSLNSTGEVLGVDPAKQLELRWLSEYDPEIKAEGYSHFLAKLEPQEGVIKLTISHRMDLPHTKFIASVSWGWPMVLSNLKSFLETGKAIIQSKLPPT